MPSHRIAIDFIVERACGYQSDGDSVMPDVECTVWCAHCETDKFRVVRKPTGQNGVYGHEIEWTATGRQEHVEGGTGRQDTKTCDDCGEQLSRKE